MTPSFHAAPTKPEKATKNNPEHGSTRTGRIEKKDIGNARNEKPKPDKRKDS